MSLSETLENIGFKTLCGFITFNKLAESAPLPCIIHWNQEHFVILVKIVQNALTKKSYCYIADPASGIYKVTEEEFKSRWNSTLKKGEEKGIALLCEPTSHFYNKKCLAKKKKYNLKFLFNYVRNYKKLFVQLILGLFLASLIQLVFPFLTQSIVDIGIADKDISFIYLILLGQIVLFLSKTIIEYIRSWLLLHISIRINISLISDFLIKLTKLPMTFFDSKMLGDILQRINDHQRIENFLTSRTITTIFSLFSLLIFAVVLLIYSTKIFLIFIVSSILYALWISFFLKRRRVLDYELFNTQAKNESVTYQFITGMQEIKLQGCEKRKRWEWEDTQSETFNLHIKSLSLEQIQQIGGVFLSETKNILITIFTATAVIKGEMTLGMMLAIQYIIGQLNSPIDHLVQLITDFQDVKLSIERVNEIHNKKDEDEENLETILSDNINDSIQIQNLVFQYNGPKSPKVLNDLNLSIPPKKVTAIVGASGSGKTTLVKLLLKYYSPIEGNILVGNQDLTQLNSKLWRANCGVVMQDGYIFTDSIARNIACDDSEIDVEQLQYASKIACVDKFVEKLPLKYNTVIGNDGQNLSQGQKQRILIARAVYKNPDYLFFDEATNSLDANNEKEIVENLQEFYKNRTVLIVAHRLSTVKNADQIIVLNDGDIVEQGTHNMLVQKKGSYYKLVKNQLELGL